MNEICFTQIPLINNIVLIDLKNNKMHRKEPAKYLIIFKKQKTIFVTNTRQHFCSNMLT